MCCPADPLAPVSNLETAFQTEIIVMLVTRPRVDVERNNLSFRWRCARHWNFRHGAIVPSVGCLVATSHWIYAVCSGLRRTDDSVHTYVNAQLSYLVPLNIVFKVDVFHTYTKYTSYTRMCPKSMLYNLETSLSRPSFMSAVFKHPGVRLSPSSGHKMGVTTQVPFPAPCFHTPWA